MERYMQISGGVLGTVGTYGTVCISDVPVYLCSVKGRAA